MIRPFTCLTVLLAAGSGLYLYTEKHRTTLLDEKIRAVVEDTNRIEDRTSMLRAEWALLNQPDRLQTLAAKFLPKLQPMAPTQFVQAADLDAHLPPVGPPPGSVTPANGPGTTPGAGEPSPTSVPDGAPLALASLKAQKSNKTVPIAVASRTEARPVHPTATHAPVVRVAARIPRQDTLRAMVAAAWATRTAPAAPSAANLVRPVMSYARPAPVYAGAWRVATPAAPAPSSYAGSALGMAHTALAPPMAAR